MTDGDPRLVIRRLNRFGVIAVLLLIGGAGGWAATSEISGAVIAPGVIVVDSNIKKVQHPTGGVVGEILVREGDPVEEGQVLIRLDDTVTRANLGAILSQLHELTAHEARLLAERDGAQTVDFSDYIAEWNHAKTAVTARIGEEKLFESRRKTRTGQRAQLRERIAQTKEEITGLSAQLAAKEQEIKFVGEELTGVSTLYAQNLVTIVRYMQLQKDKARLEGERGQLIAEIARARGRISEIELQIIQIDQDFRTEVLRDLRETQGKIAELQERRNAAEDQLRRIDLRAPQAGFVHQLSVHTVGGVIGNGETVMYIVPRNDTLVVEARVPPQDIDQLENHAQVVARIMAGNQRTMPDLHGTLERLPVDLTRDSPNTPPYYLVRATLSPADVKRLDHFKLVPGMPVELFIRTHSRTPLQYLIKPLREQIDRTFRER